MFTYPLNSLNIPCEIIKEQLSQRGRLEREQTIKATKKKMIATRKLIIIIIKVTKQYGNKEG